MQQHPICSSITKATPHCLISWYGQSLDSEGNKWIGTAFGGFARYDGTEWSVYDTSNSPLPDNDVNVIVIDSEDTKWIGTFRGGLLKHNGTDWTVFNTSNSVLPHNWVTSIAIDSQGTKWIGTLNGLASYDGNGWSVFQTSNSGIPYNFVYSVAVDVDGSKWIGTDGAGICKYDGTTCTVFNMANSGLTYNYIKSIVIDRHGNKWIATDNGLKVYNEGGIVSVETLDNTDRPETFLLSQNYPNPFNRSTTIRYDLQRRSQITLKIYNILGQEVVTLLDRVEKHAGCSLVSWDGRGRSGQPLSSGIYLYRLQTAVGPPVTKKMSVLK